MGFNTDAKDRDALATCVHGATSGVTEIDRGHAIDVGAVARKVGNWPAHVVAYIASFRLSTSDLRQGELESDERTAASPAAGERPSDWRGVVTACPGCPGGS